MAKLDKIYRQVLEGHSLSNLNSAELMVLRWALEAYIRDTRPSGFAMCAEVAQNLLNVLNEGIPDE